MAEEPKVTGHGERDAPAPQQKEQAGRAEPPEKAPSKEQIGKVIDFPAKDDAGIKLSGDIREIPIDRDTLHKETQFDGKLQQEKPVRPRKPKAEKAEPAGKSRAAKYEKTVPKKEATPRDRVSRSSKGKAQPGTPAEPSVTDLQEPAAPPRPVAEGKVVYVKLSELHPFHTFREHPYKVTDDERMDELVGTIKEHGVMTPITVRPEKNGGGYEVIAGHRRCHGSERAGLDEIPCIIREMSDLDAVKEMRISNKQRGDPLPSELARLLDLEMEALKHQGSPLAGVAASDVGKRSAEIVGENNGMNYKKVMRYVRLNSLVPELLDMVDAKRIGFMPAVEMSYIKPKNQRLIAVSIEGEQSSPSVAQAKKLRELDKDGKLTGDIIDGILSEEKKEVDRVIISTEELGRYFGKEATPREMKDQIIALLDEWKAKQPPEKAAPVKSAERG